MLTETTSPHRPTTFSILTVRALFSHRFRIPTEITNQILDYAHYWLSTLTLCSDLPLSQCHSSRSLVETPPLGSAHGGMVGDGSGGRTASVPMRGKAPCREIRMSLHVKGVKVLRSRDFWTSPGGALQTVSYIQPNFAPAPAARPFVIALVKSLIPSAGDAKAWVSNFGQYTQRKDQEKTKAAYWDGKVVAVIEEPLEEREDTKNIVWSWKDEGDGGDLVRSMKEGDRLSLSSNMLAYGWGFSASKLEVEVRWAI
ncbi:hypothetical protein BDR22DRAFT_884296 [Usnea florida]